MPLRSIGLLLVCVAALMGLASAVRAQEAVGGPYAVSVVCELVPYRHCVLSISGETRFANVDPTGFVIILENRNILISPGRYRGKWNVVSGGGRTSTFAVDALIEQGRAHLIVKESVRKMILRRIPQSHAVFAWKSSSLPLAIRNTAIKQGDIRAILLYDNREVGSSEDMMWPAKGCWLNEVRCVPH